MLVKMTQTPPKTLLVDGNAHVWRAFYGIGMLTDPQGRPINAVFGFLRTLLYVIEKYLPSHIAVVFDSRSNRRKAIYPEYKANRKSSQDTTIVDLLFPQLDIAREMTEALGLYTVKVDGYEADDLICDLAHRSASKGIDTLIFSRDKDFAQLVDRDKKINLLYPHSNSKGEDILGWNEICEKFKVAPNQIVDYLSLAGDTADNIPGVRGIGEGIASKLLTQYESVEKIYENISLLTPGLQKKLTEGREMVHISKMLAELCPEGIEELDGFPEKAEFTTFASGAREYVTNLGFKSLVSRI